MSLSVEQLLNDETFIYIARRALQGTCTLFLGAGASLSSGAPRTQELANLIAKELLMTDEEFALADAAAFADSHAGRPQVARVIVDRLKHLKPAPALLNLTRVPWVSIYTTNFDDLIVKSYDMTPETRSKAVEVYEPSEGFRHTTPGSTPLYMLHGSIHDPLNPSLGLVLTADDIRKSTQQRNALFRKLLEDAQQHEVVYIGFSLADSDFQAVIDNLWDIASNDPKMIPRGYSVLPNVRSFIARFWEGKKITLIDSDLESFAQAITQLASGREAVKAIAIGSTPSLPKFLSAISPSTELASELEWAFEFPELSGDEPDPDGFFRGGPPSWSTIRAGYDAIRDRHDDAIGEILIDPADERQTDRGRRTRSVLIDGPAGTGKTTFMRRLAWDLAETWRRPVIWVRDASTLQLDLLEEVAGHADGRLYVFIDNAADAGSQVVNVIRRSRTRGLLVTFVLADRANEWDSSTRSNPLEPDRRFSLGRISKGEACQLLDRLDRAGQLGTLEGLAHEEQLSRLMERAGRQLLVALREATEGKRFDEIILDEYGGIPNDKGRLAYLYVCSLFQFGVLTRAGILSRLVGVPLGEFSDVILQPTKRVIVEEQPTPQDQPKYRARHEVIAAIVFRRALETSQARAALIMSMIRQLDVVGYEDDRRAFIEMTKYRWLKYRLDDPADIADIYALARKIRPNDPFVLQQQALSLRRTDPLEANSLLRDARELAPSSESLQHTEAVILIDQAVNSQGQMRDKLFSTAEAEFRALIRRDPENSAPYVSLAKLKLESAKVNPQADVRIALLAEARDVLGQAFKRCIPTHQMFQMSAILQEQAGTIADAERDYRLAVSHSEDNVQIWLSLADFISKHKSYVEAIDVLNEALNVHPTDPLLNYHLALTLIKADSKNQAAIRLAFDYAVTEAPLGFLPRLDYAIWLHMNGDVDRARDQFSLLTRLNIPHKLRVRPRCWLETDGNKTVFIARIAWIGANNSYVHIDELNERVFLSTRDIPADSLKVGTKLSVNLFYNCLGLRAFPIGIPVPRDLALLR